MMSARLLCSALPRPVPGASRRIALAALLLCGMASVPSLRAAPQVVDAEDLDLSVPCLGRFEIMVDPAMSDGVSIDSPASGGAHLTMRTGKTQGSSKVLITSKACAPTAKVSILVAPNVGVMIHDSHDTHIVIHGTLASLEASLEAGQLDADTIQSLDLSLRGTEQVHIAHLNRAAQVVETGASGLVVDQADLDAFSAQLSETSHLSVTDGRFDVLTLMVENAASARLGGTVNTATVSANGTGLVAIPTVSGPLTRTGNVQVGPNAATTSQPAAPATPPAAATAAPPAVATPVTSTPAVAPPAPPAAQTTTQITATPNAASANAPAQSTPSPAATPAPPPMPLPSTSAPAAPDAPSASHSAPASATPLQNGPAQGTTGQRAQNQASQSQGATNSGGSDTGVAGQNSSGDPVLPQAAPMPPVPTVSPVQTAPLPPASVSRPALPSSAASAPVRPGQPQQWPVASPSTAQTTPPPQPSTPASQATPATPARSGNAAMPSSLPSGPQGDQTR